ncbi:hypothetical protein AB0D29_34845 [Streptomyces sp. NPDC048424]|uniref:hypothetical protein n=1 Tax=Streptomyces sp. NPDC048424 TaxID=3155265 RepID=UPI00343DE2FB
MTLVSLSAPPDHPVRRVDRHLVTDVIWATAAPADRLEHVYARSAEGRLDIALFLLAAGAEEAASAGGRIVRRALAGAPALAGWRTDPVPFGGIHREGEDPVTDGHPW